MLIFFKAVELKPMCRYQRTSLWSNAYEGINMPEEAKIYKGSLHLCFSCLISTLALCRKKKGYVTQFITVFQQTVLSKMSLDPQGSPSECPNSTKHTWKTFSDRIIQMMGKSLARLGKLVPWVQRPVVSPFLIIKINVHILLTSLHVFC